MSRSRPRAALLFVFLCGAGDARSQGAIPGRPAADDAGQALRWKFHEGETLRYEFRQKRTYRPREEKEKGPTVVSELALTLAWSVEKVEEDGSAVLGQRVESAVESIDGPGSDVRYDSRKREEGALKAGALAALYDAALGGTYRIRIDPRGRILEAGVPSEVTRAIGRSPFFRSADAGSVFTPTGLKGLLGQHIPVFPDGPVAVGENWDRSLDLPLGEVDMVIKSRLRLKEGGTPLSNFIVDISFEVRAVEPSKLTVSLDEGSGTGEVQFDNEVGRLKSSRLSQHVDMTLKIGDLVLPQTVEVESSLKLVP